MLKRLSKIVNFGSASLIFCYSYYSYYSYHSCYSHYSFYSFYSYYIFFYILSGISIPSNPIPEVITLATFAESNKRKFFTSAFSSFKIGDA